MATAITEARRLWNAIGAQTEKNSIKPTDVNTAAQTSLDAVEETTPAIGSNGNWYVGTIDTGVKARGPQGAPGAQGPQGNPGQDSSFTFIELEITGNDAEFYTTGNRVYARGASEHDVNVKLIITNQNDNYLLFHNKSYDREVILSLGGFESGGVIYGNTSFEVQPEKAIEIGIVKDPNKNYIITHTDNLKITTV